MINGKRYSWEDITARMPHGVLLDIDSIEYSDERETEAIYGKGSSPRGWGAGNYSAKGKLTLLKEEFDRLVDYAKQLGVALYRIPPFPITVSYANEDQPLRTDVLKGCVISSVSHSASQGDSSVKVELEIQVLNGIWRDGLRPN